jgi:hypothetical protein
MRARFGMRRGERARVSLVFLGAGLGWWLGCEVDVVNGRM